MRAAVDVDDQRCGVDGAVEVKDDGLIARSTDRPATCGAATTMPRTAKSWWGLRATRGLFM